MNKKRNISGSHNGAKKRPNTDVEKSDPKNIGVYKHSSDSWKIKINEDSWTIFENQIVPKAAKEFIELPLQDLIELGILIKIDTGYTTLKSFFLKFSLTVRNMQVKFCLKVVLECRD